MQESLGFFLMLDFTHVHKSALRVRLFLFSGYKTSELDSLLIIMTRKA